MTTLFGIGPLAPRPVIAPSIIQPPDPAPAHSCAAQVHTFDCTCEGKVLDPARHTYHKICIGNTPPPGSQMLKRLQRRVQQMGSVMGTFESFHNLTRRLGHHKIALLKVRALHCRAQHAWLVCCC